MVKFKIGNLSVSKQAIWRIIFYGFCVGITLGFGLGKMETSGTEFPYLIFAVVNILLAVFFLPFIRKAVRVKASKS